MTVEISDDLVIVAYDDPETVINGQNTEYTIVAMPETVAAIPGIVAETVRAEITREEQGQ